MHGNARPRTLFLIAIGAGSGGRAMAHKNREAPEAPGASVLVLTTLDPWLCHRGGRQHALRLFRPKP